MTDHEFEAKKQRVLDQFGGMRNTMAVFLKDLEAQEQYERCKEVKELIERYDAGDETAFDGF